MRGSKLIEFACGSPRYFHCKSLYGIGLGNHTRPPQKQVRRFFPVSVVRPRFLKHKNRKSALAEHLALNAIAFTKSITRKDGPVLFYSKCIDPIHIWRIRIKSLFEMHHLPDFIGRKLRFAASGQTWCPTWRQIVVQKEVQWTVRAKPCSNLIAASTNLAGTS